MTSAARTTRLPVAVIGAFAILLSADTCPAADADLRSGRLHLNVGFSASVFADVDTDDARSVTKLWTDQILNRLVQEATSENTIYPDVKNLEIAFREKNVDLVAIVSDDYVSLQERVPIQPVFVTENSNGIFHQIVLLVRRDRGIRTLRDLRNKQLLIPLEQTRTIHKTWLETLLMKEGARSATEFFSTVKEVLRPSQGILPVFFHQADACLTTRESFRLMVEMNPQVGKDLTVFAASPDLVGGVIAFRPDYDEQLKGKLMEVLQKLPDDPQGRQILKLFRMNRLVPFRREYLDTVEAILREHRRLTMTLAKGK